MSLRTPINHSCTSECPHCYHEDNYSFSIENLEYASSAEREMGTEIQYDFTVEVPCMNCGKDFEICGEVWEYPEGAVNLITPEN